MPPSQVGLELADYIGEGLRSGRAGWWLGPQPDAPGAALGAPFFRALQASRSGRRLGFMAETEPETTVLYPRLALALLTEGPARAIAMDQLNDRERSQGKRLWAAGLRDLLGLSNEAIADACGYGGIHAADTAKRDVRRARVELYRIGAWPWFQFGASGRPPADWRRADLPGDVARTLAVWQAGRL